MLKFCLQKGSGKMDITKFDKNFAAAAVEKDGKTMQEFRKRLENDFSFMAYAPFIFISAKTGQRLEKLFELINSILASFSLCLPSSPTILVQGNPVTPGNILFLLG